MASNSLSARCRCYTGSVLCQSCSSTFVSHTGSWLPINTLQLQYGPQGQTRAQNVGHPTLDYDLEMLTRDAALLKSKSWHFQVFVPETVGWLAPPSGHPYPLGINEDISSVPEKSSTCQKTSARNLTAAGSIPYPQSRSPSSTRVAQSISGSAQQPSHTSGHDTTLKISQSSAGGSTSSALDAAQRARLDHQRSMRHNGGQK